MNLETSCFIFTYHSKSHPAEEKSSLKGLGEPFWNFTPHAISPQRLTLETSNFVHGSAMQSLSLVMSECFVSGRGQGHVSNFCIVDLENFATASRRYTGDIHNSTVVGLFMSLETMAADSIASWLSARCLSRIASD